MKQIITIVLAAAIAPFAFAITDAQKSAFAAKLKDVVIPAQKANDSLGADKVPWGTFLETVYIENKLESTVKPVAEWAASSPLEANSFIKQSGSVASIGLIRYYLESKSILDWEACSAEQSAVIFDHRKEYDAAYASTSAYEALKANGFISGGLKMSSPKIAGLAKKYGDVATYEAQFKNKNDIASRFGEYLDVLAEAAAAAPTKKAAYEKYASVEAEFESMKSVPEVAKNWAKFIGALDAAWLRYERAIKTGSEQ